MKNVFKNFGIAVFFICLFQSCKKSDINTPGGSDSGNSQNKSWEARLFIGDQQGIVYAINPYTGSLAWESQIKDQTIRNSVAVENTTTVFVTSTGNVDDVKNGNMLTALNMADGIKKWEVSFPAEPGGFKYDISHPILYKGVLYLNTKSTLYAINTSDGSIKWKKTGLGYLSPDGGTFVPNLNLGTLYLNTDYDLYSARLVAIDATNGNKIWEYKDAEYAQFQGNPAISNGMVFVKASKKNNVNGCVHAINTATGKLIWKSGIISHINSSAITIAGNLVYLQTAWNDIIALNIADGSKKWNSPDYGNYVIASSPKVINGVLYAGYFFAGIPNSTGKLLAFDAKDGTKKLEAAFITQQEAYATDPVIFNNTAYLHSHSAKKVFALNTANGVKKWEFTTKGSIDSYVDPVIVTSYGAGLYGSRSGMNQ